MGQWGVSKIMCLLASTGEASLIASQTASRRILDLAEGLVPSPVSPSWPGKGDECCSERDTVVVGALP